MKTIPYQTRTQQAQTRDRTQRFSPDTTRDQEYDENWIAVQEF